MNGMTVNSHTVDRKDTAAGATASGTAGSSASKYLVVKVGGTTYKILLLANA